MHIVRDADTAGELRWYGTALLRPGVLAFRGSIGPTDTHAHHAVQLVTATTPITVVDAAGERHHGTRITVPADMPHRIETGAAHGIALYLDPETAAGAVADRLARTHGWVGHDTTLAPDAGLADQVAATLRNLQSDNSPQDHAGEYAHAVAAALRLLPALVGEGPLRTGDLAHRIGISATRLTHLFTAQVGIPLRRYILWHRLHIAITEVRAGADLTAAAHAAGFSDSAHLTRTCRRAFGLPPSALSRSIDWDLGQR